jgi:hypothetical protein
MPGSDPSVEDVNTGSSFKEVVARILDLQVSWSSQNTPEMQERGVLVRQAGPRLVKGMLAGLSSLIPDLAVEGRDGTGRKTRVPWIRVYSKSRSPSATSGWYVAALFAADGSAVFLSINQGTTSFEAGSLKASATDLLEARVRWAQGILGATIDKAGASVDEIDLKDPVGLGAGYERANVCSYRFTRDELSDDLFRDRLRSLVGLLQELYAAEDDPARRMAELQQSSILEPLHPVSPPLSDTAAFIQAVRGRYGPTLVESRRAAEEEARQLLNQLAGGMTKEQAQTLGQLFNRGEWAGVMRHNRFLPAFAGATMDRLLEPIETFNEWTGRLWRSPEEEARQAVDEVLRNPNAFPGAGRSYPTMLMYLRDPHRFAIWLQVCHQGLVAISDYDEPRGRTGGVDRYLRYCAAVREFAERWGLEPQEVDAVLVAAARAAAEVKDATARRGEGASGGDSGEVVVDPRQVYSLEKMAVATHLPLDLLEEWVGLLRGRKRQALLYGPPGTGKTFVAQQLARHLAGDDGSIQLIQFHPSFSYEDFLEGLRPTSGSNGQVGYEVRDGVFFDFCATRAQASPGTHVFVIDELNRAELGAVLGELMTLLEYRGREVQLPYSQRLFSVPENVILLATMNTADRSLALVDFALRRRFHAFEMRPSRDVLESYLKARDEDTDLVLRFFDLVQERVASPDYAPGHSYWMTEDLSPQGLSRVWRYELYPYLAEYWFEHRNYLDDLNDKVTRLLAEEA